MLRIVILVAMASALTLAPAAPAAFDESVTSTASGSSAATVRALAVSAMGPIVDVTCTMRLQQWGGGTTLNYSGRTSCDMPVRMDGQAYIQHLGVNWSVGNTFVCSVPCSFGGSAGSRNDAVNGYTYHYYFKTKVTLSSGMYWVTVAQGCVAGSQILNCSFHRAFTHRS
jgi:hypothetical protein